MPPDAENKIVKIETDANKVLNDPSASPQQKESATNMLEKATSIRATTAEAGRTALKGWSAYAEMELIDAYVRGMIEARKSGLKGSMYASAWKRMGAIVGEVGVDAVNEPRERTNLDSRSDEPSSV